MRLRCSERSGALDGSDLEPLEVPKRLSGRSSRPSLLLADLLAGGMGEVVSLAG